MRVYFWFAQPQIGWEFSLNGKTWTIVQVETHVATCVCEANSEEWVIELGNLIRIATEQWQGVAGYSETPMSEAPEPGSVMHCWGAVAYPRKPPS